MFLLWMFNWPIMPRKQRDTFELICWALLALRGAHAALFPSSMLTDNSVLLDAADTNSPTGQLRAAMSSSAEAQLEVRRNRPRHNGQSLFAWFRGILHARVLEYSK